jgi:hypothetical protein
MKQNGNANDEGLVNSLPKKRLRESYSNSLGNYSKFAQQKKAKQEAKNGILKNKLQWENLGYTIFQ